MNRVQIQFIKDALDQPEKLSDWENERVGEWAEYDESRDLSEKQNEILNRISQKLD